MVIDSNKQYAFSLDGEKFETDSEIIMDQIKEHKIIYVGEQKRPHHKDFIKIDSLIENMQEAATFESEYADDYLEDFTEEHESELEKLILEYMDKNLSQPNFYEAVNIQEISVEEFKKLFC